MINTVPISRSAYTVALSEDISKLPTGTADLTVALDLIDPHMHMISEGCDYSIDYYSLLMKNRTVEYIPTKTGAAINYMYLNYTS